MNIDSSYINAYNINGIQQSSLEKIGNASAINSTSDDSSESTIADQFESQKNSISQSIENISSGIALSNIAQSGISSQKEILENIQEETLKALSGTTSQKDKGIIEQEISNYIEEFENIADSTTYNGTPLLKTKDDSSDDLSIVTNESTIELEKADTVSISDELKSFLTDFSSNTDSQTELLNLVAQGITQLSSFESDFESASNALISSARNSISTEQELSLAQSTVLDVDYAEEVSDFSKTNLLSQIGLVVQSQANAIQGRNISLLSF